MVMIWDTTLASSAKYMCLIYLCIYINKIAGGHSILVEYTLCLHITNKIIRCFFVLK